MSHNFVVSGKMFVKSENNEVVNILVDCFDNGASSWDYNMQFHLRCHEGNTAEYSFNGTSAYMFSDEFVGNIKEALEREHGEKAKELVDTLELNEFSLRFKMKEYNAGTMFLAEEEFYIRHKAGVPLEDTIADECEFYREHPFTAQNLLDIAEEDPEVVEGLFAC